jgi:serine/threonine-protein kinase
MAKKIYEKEINTMKRVDHPHVVKIWKEGQTNEGLYLIMKYYPGGDLERKSRAVAKMKRSEIIQWLDQSIRGLIEGILAVHKAGVIHRDIKPHNILIDEAGRLVLADFGVAYHQSDEVEEGTFTGTPLFSAPEQLRGKVTEAADWFNLGATLYYLLTGKHVFDGVNTNEVINEMSNFEKKKIKIRPINQVNPQIPQPIADFIMNLLEPEPEKRLGDNDVQLNFDMAVG